MPRNTEQRFSNRTPIYSKAPSEKLEVVARATDPFVAQGRDNQDVIAALASINPAIEAYGKMQESNKVDNTKQAIADQMAASKLPGYDPTAPLTNKPTGFFNSGAGYDDAYYHADGEARVGDWSQKWQEILKQNNFFRDSQTPQDDYNKAFKDHYDTTFQAVGGNQKIMAAVAPLFYATKAKTDAEFMLHQDDQAKQTFMSNIDKIQTSDLKGAVSSSNFDPVAIKKIIDNDYYTKIKHNPMGLAISRTAYNTAVVGNINRVALGLINDPTLTTSEALSKAAKALSVLKAIGSEEDGTPGISLSDVKDAEGKSTFRALIDSGEAAVHTAYNTRHTADDTATKEKAKEATDNFILTRAFNPDVPMSTIRQELSLLPPQADKMKAYDTALKFRNNDEDIDKDNTRLTQLKYDIETTTSVSTLRKLYDTTLNGMGDFIGKNDVDSQLQRITARINEVQNKGLTEKSLNMTLLSQAADRIKSTYAPLIQDAYGGAKLALIQEQNKKLDNVLQVYRTGGDTLKAATEATKDATSGRIKPTDLNKPRPDWNNKSGNDLKKEISEGRATTAAVVSHLKGVKAQREAEEAKLLKEIEGK